MKHWPWRIYALVAGSLLVALFLSVLPLPLSWRWWRPDWVLLTVIFWISLFPLSMSLLFLCAFGLYQDLLESVPLGQHGLSLLIIAYICILSYQRTRNFSIRQEAGWIFVLVGLAQLPTYWVQTMAGRPLTGLWFLAPAVTSALVWPLVRAALYRLCDAYRIGY